MPPLLPTVRPSRAISLVAAAIVVGRAPLAAASPTAVERETARGLMAEGRAARARGDVKGALKAFGGADAIMHVPTTGFELARIQAAAGLLVEARDTALHVTRMPEEAGEPAPFHQARNGASTLEGELEGRIPSIRVTVTRVPEGTRPRVSVDEIDTPPEVLEQPLRVNPGHHTVRVQAGTANGEQEVEIAEKETKDVAIELPAQEQDPETAASPPTPSNRPVMPEKPQPGSQGPPALAISGFSAAGAGVLTGLLTGLAAIEQTHAVKNSGECQDRGTLCNPSEAGAIQSARTLSTASDVAFFLAGAGAAVGVVGLFVGGEAPRTAARVEPWVGLGALGLKGQF